MAQLQDRVAGILVGLAAGDENGGPTEMALRLAQGLLALRRYDPDDVFSRYLEWHRAGSYDTGPVTGRVLDLALEGLAPEAAVPRVDAELGGMTAGCNAAHRAGVLAMAPWLATEALVEAAEHEARLTHHHPIAADAAVAVVLECRRSLMPENSISTDQLRRVAARLHPEVREAWGVDAERAAARAGGSAAREPLDNGGYSPETLRAALHFARPAQDPVAALAASKRFAGPANYCPVLVGAFLGARFGASAFDDGQLAHHPSAHRAAIRETADGLARLWTADSPALDGEPQA